MTNRDPATGHSFSLGRLLATIAVVLLVAAVAYWYGKNSVKPAIPEEQLQLKMYGLDRPTINRLEDRYVDADGDLVADPPTDASQSIDPEVLYFSYGTTQQGYHHTEQVWSDLVTHLAEQTGKPVEYLVIDTPSEQVAALSEGRLHIAGVNPGNVPLAVNTCGFVPVCTVGKGGIGQTYTMQIIVPAKSEITEVEDLRGRTVTFTDSSSNSGWKAPLVVLMRDFGFFPMRDYMTNASFSHAASIEGVATEKYEAAAIASSELFLGKKRGDIADDQVRIIYESQPFPYDCIGHLHHLKPELAEKVQSALLSFDWIGTSVGKEFAALGFDQYVTVSFKDDLALVRQIDDSMGRQHSLELDSFVVPPSR